MAKQNLFVVEAVRQEIFGSLPVKTVVLLPADGNDIFKDNALARVELSRIRPEQAEQFTVGLEVEVSIKE